MRTLKIMLLCILAVGLSACSAQDVELPQPDALFETLQASVDLPQMVDVAADMLEANTGIAPSDYSHAVYYVLAEGMAPDEIIIIHANDKTGAADIEEKLKSWLSYREESARVYLTEYMPLIQNGVVRRDGMTVSLIVSPKADEIIQFYDEYQ